MLSDSKLSYESVNIFKTMITRTCGKIPIVVVVNKCELNNSIVNYHNLKQENNIVLISCKNNISIYEPLNKIINLLNIN